jgi:hypothetical protein
MSNRIIAKGSVVARTRHSGNGESYSVVWTLLLISITTLEKAVSARELAAPSARARTPECPVGTRQVLIADAGEPSPGAGDLAMRPDGPAP